MFGRWPEPGLTGGCWERALSKLWTSFSHTRPRSRYPLSVLAFWVCIQYIHMVTIKSLPAKHQRLRLAPGSLHNHLDMCVFTVYMYRPWHIHKHVCQEGLLLLWGCRALSFSSCQCKKKERKCVMEMRLKDYRNSTDYSDHKQWDHDAVWAIWNWPFNFTSLPQCCHLKWALRVIWKWETLCWIHTEVLFRGSFVYSALCRAVYTRQPSDRTQDCMHWYHSDKRSVPLALAVLGACGFHYGSVVSISPHSNRGAGAETDFNPGWTPPHTSECLL